MRDSEHNPTQPNLYLKPTNPRSPPPPELLECDGTPVAAYICVGRFVLIKHVAYLNSVRSRSIENNQSSKIIKPDPDFIKNHKRGENNIKLPKPGRGGGGGGGRGGNWLHDA